MSAPAGEKCPPPPGRVRLLVTSVPVTVAAEAVLRLAIPTDATIAIPVTEAMTLRAERRGRRLADPGPNVAALRACPALISFPNGSYMIFLQVHRAAPRSGIISRTVPAPQRRMRVDLIRLAFGDAAVHATFGL